MAASCQRLLQSQSCRGMASIEVLPILVIFTMMLGYTLGLWGAVHSAILQSIAARTYAFETFRSRSNLNFIRSNARTDEQFYYGENEVRLFSIVNENLRATDDSYKPATRPLAIGRAVDNAGASPQDHNSRIYALDPRNESVQISPIWIMVSYGICLNSNCGDG